MCAEFQKKVERFKVYVDLVRIEDGSKEAANRIESRLVLWCRKESEYQKVFTPLLSFYSKLRMLDQFNQNQLHVAQFRSDATICQICLANPRRRKEFSYWRKVIYSPYLGSVKDFNFDDEISLRALNLWRDVAVTYYREWFPESFPLPCSPGLNLGRVKLNLRDLKENFASYQISRAHSVGDAAGRLRSQDTYVDDMLAAVDLFEEDHGDHPLYADFVFEKTAHLKLGIQPN